MAYDLSDPLEFVGFRLSLSGLRVLKARKKDEANPNIKAFKTVTTIGATGSTFTELKVFNGTIKGPSLRSLMTELRHKQLWVNRDGYCYMRIPGTKSTRPPQPTKFIRLNDLFAWEDYVEVPRGETFNPSPSSTIWNRLDSSSGDKKVDYEKLDSDLKQAKDDKKKAEDDKKQAEDDKKKAENDKKKAENDKKKAEDDKKKAENDKKKAENDKKKAEDDKKKAENDKKKAENDKKKAEDDKKKAENDKKKAVDELQEVRKQKREMDEWMDRLKENWVKAASVGAKPLPPSAFYISSIPNPNARGVEPLSVTWMGQMQKRISDPGSYVGSIGTGSIQIHNAANGYGNDGFETHFWWVVQMDGLNNGVYGYMIAFEGSGRYPSPTDQLNFMRIRVIEDYPIGGLNLPGVGYRNVIILRSATQGVITFRAPN